MRKACAYVHSNRIYVSAFFIPVFVMVTIFACVKIYPFGDRSFLHIDMYHQYFPFLTDFYHALRGISDGSGLFYSFNGGLGVNFTALYDYYLSSPFNLVAVMIPERFLIEFQSCQAVIKIGLCGLTFSVYISERFKSKDPLILVFSTFYALSGYIAAYNWDVMWLDVVALSPLVILGLERLVESGGRSIRLYVISLALSLICNYYLSIMLCIFLVLYYLTVLIPKAAAGSFDGNGPLCHGLTALLRITGAFAGCSLLSGGIVAFLLIPSYMSVRLTKFIGTSFPSDIKAYFPVYEMIGRHLMDVEVETGLDHWPNIYASVAIFILLPLYVICRQISIREKLGRLSLLLFLFCSFSVNILAFIWHGFNYPDSLPARQSYLYIFLLLSMCYEALMHIREYSRKELCIISLVSMGSLVCVQRFVTDEAVTERSIALSAVVVCIYLVLMYIYRQLDEPGRLMTYVTIMVAILEAGINMSLTSVPTVSRTAYLQNFDDYKHLYDSYNELALNSEALDETGGRLYRFERENRLTNNDAMLKAYPSLSMFSSIGNGLVNSFYSDYGMRSSKVFFCADGVTPFMRALLADKYVFVEDKDDDMWVSRMRPAGTDKEASASVNPAGVKIKRTAKSGVVNLYEYDNTLPVGYMLYESEADVSALISDYDMTAFAYKDKANMADASGKKDIDPVERQNMLAKALGSEYPLYICTDSVYQSDNADITVTDDGYYIAYCDTKKIDTLKVSAPFGDTEYKKLKNPYIINIGYLDAGDTVNISNEDGADLHMKLYRMQDDVYNDVIGRLNTDTLYIDNGGYCGGRLTGHLEAKDDGYLILSIPYDQGFKVYVDGVRTVPKLAYGMMYAIDLTTGRHVIELKYVPQGLISGIILSLLSVTVFILICMHMRHIHGEKPADTYKTENP